MFAQKVLACPLRAVDLVGGWLAGRKKTIAFASKQERLHVILERC